MKAGVIVLLLGVAVMMAGVAARADGWATTYSLTNGSVGVSNSQANSCWTPVAVLWKFSTVTNAQLAVHRESQGSSFVLSQFDASNTASVVWVPEAAYPFSFGDTLLLISSFSNGQVQVIRKAN